MYEYQLDHAVPWHNILTLYHAAIRKDASKCRKIYASFSEGQVSSDEMEFYLSKIREDYETLCALNTFLNQENNPLIDRLVKPWLILST